MIRLEVWNDGDHVTYMDYFAETEMEAIKFYDWVERFRQANDPAWELRIFNDETNDPMQIGDLLPFGERGTRSTRSSG